MVRTVINIATICHYTCSTQYLHSYCLHPPSIDNKAATALLAPSHYLCRSARSQVMSTRANETSRVLTVVVSDSDGKWKPCKQHGLNQYLCWLQVELRFYLQTSYIITLTVESVIDSWCQSPNGTLKQNSKNKQAQQKQPEEKRQRPVDVSPPLVHDWCCSQSHSGRALSATDK